MVEKEQAARSGEGESESAGWSNLGGDFTSVRSHVENTSASLGRVLLLTSSSKLARA